jgi:hypothetical protein
MAIFGGNYQNTITTKNFSIPTNIKKKNYICVTPKTEFSLKKYKI